MALSDLDIQIEYRNQLHDIIGDFYLPTLKETVLYKRAVGFFNSGALYEIAIGINDLIKNGGRIQLIASPKLDPQDIKDITLGYEERDKIIERAIVREISIPETSVERRKLNLLSNLIAENVLDIKIAYKREGDSFGIFHDKMGLMYDAEDNKIAFSGSMNETYSGLLRNYESIDVYMSWGSKESQTRIKLKEEAFDTLWSNLDASIEVLDFPKVAKEVLAKYNEKSTHEILNETPVVSTFSNNNKEFFTLPKGKKLRYYQKEAIEAWKNQNYCGIFDMATGTGKTYTALAALSMLSKAKESLAVVIVCPYQHLVEQWVEDIELFGVNPIVAYSSNAYKRWKELFSDAVNAYKVGVKKKFCIITTNGTFETPAFQDILGKIKKDLCFVVDEAHNFGAAKLSSMMPLNSQYRLALSATIERFRDDIGTKKLVEFFGEKCIYFSLEKAIKEGFLTTYNYYPVLVYLNDEEYDKYKDISRKIAKMGGASPENCEKNPVIERLLLERSRIIAGAHNKVQALSNIIKPYKDENHMLVYCGATKYDDGEDDLHEIKQIDRICKELSLKHNMKVRKFTSSETKEERRQIKNDFVEGENLQVITAIKCLDEGVNIPAINRAFILASSTNPKEYIQRRGRVLRKFPGKEYSEIFDFVTLPRPLDEIFNLTEEERRMELSLIRKEFTRMLDFAKTAKNPMDTDKLKHQILQEYGAYGNLMEEYNEKY